MTKSNANTREKIAGIVKKMKEIMVAIQKGGEHALEVVKSDPNLNSDPRTVRAAERILRARAKGMTIVENLEVWNETSTPGDVTKENNPKC